MQYLFTRHLEYFLDLHYKLFQLIHYHTTLQVQILIIHNISHSIITNSTPYIPFLHPNHQILQQTCYKTLNFRHLILLLRLFERILTIMLPTHNLLQIHQIYRQMFPIYLRTIQLLPLQYLNLQIHTQLT